MSYTTSQLDVKQTGMQRVIVNADGVGLTAAVRKAPERAHHEKCWPAGAHCLDGVSGSTLTRM
jgi:hypothetical protein